MSIVELNECNFQWIILIVTSIEPHMGLVSGPSSAALIQGEPAIET